MVSQIEASLKKGFSFLDSNQLPSGEFLTKQWIGDDACEHSLKFPIRSVFITSFVLHSLKFIAKHVDVKRSAQKALEFLLSEMEDQGLWRFYGKESKIPFDIDCVCCILAALKEWEIEMDYENIASRLLRYRNAKNIFNTWILDEDPRSAKIKFSNVDWVVNANVLFFYSLVGERLPEVEQYLIAFVKNEAFKQRSIFYPPMSGMYCLTRAYADGQNRGLKPAISKIKEYLLSSKTENKSQDSLCTALSTVALQNCYEGKAPTAQFIGDLLNMQQIDGRWPTGVFFSSVMRGHPEISLKWGSEELTTAFALEAIAKCFDESR
jgi:hypothetical protein